MATIPLLWLAIQKDFVCEIGTDWQRTMRWSDAMRSPYDLTGCTGTLDIYDKIGGTKLLELTTANGGIVLGGAAGTITFNISKTQSSGVVLTGLPFRDVVESEESGLVRPAYAASYQFNLVQSGGQTMRWSEGVLGFRP